MILLGRLVASWNFRKPGDRVSLLASRYSSEATHSHGSDKIRLPFLKPETSCNYDRACVRYDGLDDEDDRNDGQVRQFLRRQLRSEFRKNYLKKDIKRLVTLPI